MNEIVTVENGAPRRSVTHTMANRFGMEADTFMATLDKTVFPNNMSREEKAAFLLVAQEYRLNPITREIYAMPKKGGGLIPVVSIDGWVRLANEHPQFDGMEFEDRHADDGALISTTCRIYRKDRSHPICVTEYLSECKRDTEPWKMLHRMLRHKAMIQCSRYAFGFAGIYDQDEAERFAEPLAPARRAPSPSSAPMIEARPEPVHTIDDSIPEEAAAPAPQKASETVSRRRAPSPQAAQSAPTAAPTPPAPGVDPEALRKRLIDGLANVKDVDALNDTWAQIVDPHWDDLLPPDQDDLTALYKVKKSELDG